MESRSPSAKPHWIVGTHWVMRSASFAIAFVFLTIHWWGQPVPGWGWSLLALQFLIYPHLLYWRARRTRDTQRAELQNLMLDCFVLGIWSGALGFPLWITFTLFISSAINNAISRGWPGVVRALLAFGGGALLGWLPTGTGAAPAESGWVILLCVVGLTWYLLAIGHVAYARARALRATREKLKHGELALQQANETLRARIEEIHALQHLLKDQANRDPLTSLFNRRYLQDTMQGELARCRREAQPLCVVMIDIDHFKRVNDTYGHQIGDEVLKCLGKLLADDVRSGDVACRFGGEEFLILMTGLSAAAACPRAEQWRARFAAAEIRSDGRRVPLSLSIGMAAFPEHGQTAEELVHRADQALYAAKLNGRDQVVIYAAEHARQASIQPDDVAT